MDSSKYLTADEVAKILRVRPQTIYLWATKNRMPSQKICGALRFDRAVLDRWLKTQRREVKAEGKKLGQELRN
jgi:excisionase family DNA binding protein